MADYALVVGIESYGTAVAKPLCGPSLDAIRFALWLRDRQGVPAKNIILMHNRSDRWMGQLANDYEENLKLATGIEIREDPSRSNIEKAWDELATGPAERGTLWVYWSGHGFTFPQNRQAVLCSGEESGEPSFVYLDDLRDSLRTDKFSQFDKQRLIVDACSEYIGPDALNIQGLRNPTTWNVSKSPIQIELNAVPPGRKAKAEDGGSLFSRVLFAELTEHGWPADQGLAEFSGRLVRAAEKASGDATKLPRVTISSSVLRFEAGFDLGYHAEECRELLKMLAECSIDFARYRPLYERTIGECVGADSPARYETSLTGMVRELVELQRETQFGEHSKGLVKFLERVVKQFGPAAAPVDGWLEKVPAGARISIHNELAEEASDLVLTIRLIENTVNAANRDPFPVTVSAYLTEASFSSTVAGPWCFRDLKDIPELEGAVRGVLDDAATKASRKDVRLSVQVFANPALMGIPWHDILIDPDDGLEETYGQQHSFVLRSRARLERDGKYRLFDWKDKAAALRGNHCRQIKFENAPEWSPEAGYALSRVNGMLVITEALGFPPHAYETQYKLLHSAMRCGIPLASWPVVLSGGEAKVSSEFGENLLRVFCGCERLTQTPERLRKERTTQRWARQAALLWDDPADVDKVLSLVNEEVKQL